MELQAGRELDVLVAEKIMLWPHMRYDDSFRQYTEYGGVILDGAPEKFPDNGGIIPSLWVPSIRLEDAILVAEKLREDGWLVTMKWMPLVMDAEGKTIVELEWMRKSDWSFMPIPPEIISADTPALAICRAAIEAAHALEKKEQEREKETAVVS